MQMKKRVLSALMALCMVCSLVGAAWAVIPQQTSAANNGSFTVRWNAKKDTASVTVKVNGLDDVSVLGDITIGAGNEFRFTDENPMLQVPGYEITSATYGNYSVYSLTATYNWTTHQYSYSYKSAEMGQGTSLGGFNETVNLTYQKVSETATGDLTIEDDIADTGSIVANYNGTIPENSYYKWYRQLTDGSWQEISGEIENSLEVYLDGARVTYKVELWQLNGNSAIAESYPFQVEYYDQLQNGSFEEPTVNGSNQQFTNGLYPELVWQTTGLGSLNEEDCTGQDIEIVNADQAQASYGTNQAADGEQFAELNCEAAGALYQDVMTVPGIDLYWWLSHRPRSAGLQTGNAKNPTDTMYVIIMDAEAASQYVTTQEQVDAIVTKAESSGLQDGTAGGTTVSMTYGSEQVDVTVWQLTSDLNRNQWGWLVNGGWNDYNDTYQVPEGQYLTRFFFAAGDTESDDSTVGNLIDNVGFSQDPQVEGNQGAVRVTKTVTGVDESTVIPQGTYQFTVDNQTISLPTKDATAQDADAWSATVNVNPGAYRVTETQPGNLDRYDYSSTISTVNGQVTSGLISSEGLVTKGNTTAFTFTNTYVKKEAPAPGYYKEANLIDDPNDPNNGYYELSLDVTGSVQTETSTSDLNVLMILDRSTSMEENFDSKEDDVSKIAAVKNAAISLINKLEANQNLGTISYDIVTFNSYEERYNNHNIGGTEVKLSWNSDPEKAKSTINAITIPDSAGTNWQSGIRKASEELNSQRKLNAPTCVIFFTDGVPTYALTDSWEGTSQEGNGVEPGGGYGAQSWDIIGGFARKAATEAGKLTGVDYFYGIGTFEEDNYNKAYGYLENVVTSSSAQKKQVYTAEDADSLTDVFDDIASSITNGFYNVTITDTLSDDVEFVLDSAGQPQFDIQVTDKEGKDVTGAEIQAGGLETFYDADTEKFGLNFNDNYQLKDGYTYTVTAIIKPTTEAMIEYAQSGTYPNIGDSDTGTHSNGGGFYSNKEATLTYKHTTWGDELITKEYDDPVVQVKVGNLVIQKNVTGLPSSTENHTLYSFEIQGTVDGDPLNGSFDNNSVTFTNGKATVTITGAGSVTINGLPLGTYTVTEDTTRIPDIGETHYFDSASYSDSYGTTTDGQVTLTADNTSTVTITNTYAPYRTVTITKDVGGNMGDTTNPFHFTTSVNGTPFNSNNHSNATLSSSTTATWTQDGYTLADDDTLTITKLKDGDVITLQETDGNSNGYTTVYKISETELSKDNDGNATYKVAGDANIIVTNERNVGTPTGFFEDNLPFTLMISAAGLAGIALIATILVRRQRRRRE